MEHFREINSYPLTLVEQNDEMVTGEQIRNITETAKYYLSALYKKAGVMEEESHYPILRPEEHNYINRTISAAAHLVTYWSELPDVKMPPQDKLGDTIDVLRKTGTKLESTAEDILNNEYLFRRLLSRVASRPKHTSNREPHENILAIICARQLVDLVEFMAASNKDKLPYDYSVEISLSEIANHPEQSDLKGFSYDINGLSHLLDGLEPDSSGYVRLDEARRLKLETILRDCGAAVQPPSPEEIKQGIASATSLVDSGKAEEYLKTQPFLDWDEIKPEGKSVAVALERPIYIAPDSIAGAQSFDDWRGRPLSIFKQDDMGDMKTSLEVIQDYATRGTQLPAIYLSMLPQKDSSLILYSENAHRAAAAKLRSEPIAVTALYIYK